MTCRRALPALLLAAAVLVGCTDTGGAAAPAPAGVPRSGVDVDTPELRSARRQAGIEPCRPGTGTGAGEGEGAGAEVAARLPAMTLPCLGGGADVRLSDLRGPLVVNLFAQWCGPCREELPYYERLHQQAAGSVAVLGIDYLDTQPAAALALADEAGVTYPLLADPDGALRPELRVRGLPGVVFVDEAGRVAHVEFTVVDSYRQLADLVEEHLGITP